MNAHVWVVLLTWGGEVDVMGVCATETLAQEWLEELYNNLDYPKSSFSIIGSRYLE